MTLNDGNALGIRCEYKQLQENTRKAVEDGSKIQEQPRQHRSIRYDAIPHLPSRCTPFTTMHCKVLSCTRLGWASGCVSVWGGPVCLRRPSGHTYPFCKAVGSYVSVIPPCGDKRSFKFVCSQSSGAETLLGQLPKHTSTHRNTHTVHSHRTPSPVTSE